MGRQQGIAHGRSRSRTTIEWSCGAIKSNIWNDKQKELCYKLHWKACEECREYHNHIYRDYMENHRGTTRYYVDKKTGIRNIDSQKALAGINDDTQVTQAAKNNVSSFR